MAGPITNTAVGVTNGLFTAALDFGASPFNGDARWLEISVQTNGAGSYTLLAPRQPLTPGPDALYASNAGRAATALSVAAGSISNAALALGAVDASRIAAGGIAASNLSPALLSNTFWSLTGNSGTVPNTNFIGTRDNQPLEFWVNSRRGLRLEPTTDGEPIFNAVNVVGGSPLNSILAGVRGSVIVGGGALYGANQYNFGNVVASDLSFVGGGVANSVQGAAEGSFIGGGQGNTIQSNSLCSFLGGGYHNTLNTTLNTGSSFLGGGEGNQVGAGHSVLGGGLGNHIYALADYSLIGCGNLNSIQPDAFLSFLAARLLTGH